MNRQLRRFAAAALAVVSVPLLTLLPGQAQGDALAGDAGIDTSLPETDSAVTVSGRGSFSELEVTVNQTEDLVNQAVSITWEGGAPTVAAPSRFGANYLQIMQCWGEDDGAVPSNPGPPPEQCVAGASNAVYGGIPGGLFPSASFSPTRVIAKGSWPNFDPEVGYLDPDTTLVWRTFRAVDGTEVKAHTNPDFNPEVQGGNFWQNPFFNIVTTNEIAGARTGPNGTGAELFEVHTGLESSGLGCGQAVQPTAGGGKEIPKCWIVVVPRGDALDEDVGTPFETTAEQDGVVTSPLAPAAWANRIAIPLEFTPVDSQCDIDAEQRRIDGSELAVGAVSSWQPALCESGDLPPFAYGAVNDDRVRQSVLNPVPGGSGMGVLSRPVDPDLLSPTSPIVYAPLTASGVVIGFNVERRPHFSADADHQALAGVRVAEINLTPRLVAKLLTQSYREQVAIQGVVPDDDYEWVEDNPAHLAKDPDFLRFNPEFEKLEIAAGKNFGGLMLAVGNSDAARMVWEWIFADPEAAAWLDGQPDEWDMVANPAYATSAEENTQGIPFGDPVPTSFPKSEPYCYQAPGQGDGGAVVPPPLCGTDWLPYASTLRDAARLTRAADDGAKVVNNSFALTPDQVWKRDIPQVIGARAFLSLTDSASAAQYGLQVARLSRAGDDGDGRDFVAPDEEGLAAGIDAMTANAEKDVREPDPTADAEGAYPLTALTYAAVAPLALDAAAREDYAAFLEYAVGAGQELGTERGQLPAGYAPLPDALVTQAEAAADAIRTLQPPKEDEPPVVEPPAAEPPAPETTAVDPPAPPSPPATRPSSGRSSLDVAIDDLTPVVSLPEPEPAVSIGEEPAAPTVKGPKVLTPFLAVARSRWALPVLAALMLLAALGALEITKRPRRALASDVGEVGP